MHIQFKQCRYVARWCFYRSGKLALEFVTDAGDHEGALPNGSIVTADTALPIDLDELVVAAYEDYEGVVDALILAGIVKPAFTPVFVGSWTARHARCRLTSAARKLAFSPGPHRRDDLI